MWATLPRTVKGLRLSEIARHFDTSPLLMSTPSREPVVLHSLSAGLPNQDLLPVASTEEESEKDKNRHLAGQDPN